MNDTDMHGSTDCHTDVPATPQHTHTHSTDYMTQWKVTHHTTRTHAHTPHAHTVIHTHTHTHTHTVICTHTHTRTTHAHTVISTHTHTRQQSLTRPCPCATCIWLLHTAPTSAQDGLDSLQLVLVVFILYQLAHY